MLDAVAAFIEGSGALLYVLAPLFMIIVAILPFPAEIPAMLNGMIFGPIMGPVVSWGGAMVGALVSFDIARRYGRPMAQRFLPPGTLARADRVVDATGWPGLLALRLVPTVAFTAMNWGLGFSDLPRRTFVWTTALGILPGAIAFTAFGTGLGSLYRTHRMWALVVIGVVAAALVMTGVRYWRHDKPAASIGEAGDA